eukprot:scaffold652_cov94-Skeletonema_dohrnii-CCMP3373.AAC.1
MYRLHVGGEVEIDSAIYGTRNQRKFRDGNELRYFSCQMERIMKRMLVQEALSRYAQAASVSSANSYDTSSP